MRPVRTLTLAALALLLAVAAPRAGTAPPPGPPGGPLAGPLELSTSVLVASSPLGPLIETNVLIENHGDEPLQVLLSGRFTWPDGSTGRLRYGRPTLVLADGALFVSALGVIPEGVGTGTGSFTATAIVGPIGRGGRMGHSGPLIARDTAEFELD